MFKFSPLDMSPATAEDGTASDPEGGFPHDYQQWNAGLKGVGGGVEQPTEEWQRAVADMLPSLPSMRICSRLPISSIHADLIVVFVPMRNSR